VKGKQNRRLKMPQGGQQNIDLVVVVSGQSERLKVNVHQTLAHLVHEALQRSGNQGQDSSSWELRTENGGLLDQSLTVAAAGIQAGVTLFLSPKAGAGGCASR
jgi:hypothetical protein